VAAESGADLIVVGNRGRGPLRSALRGSVSSDLADAAATPIAILPAAAHIAPLSGHYELLFGRSDRVTQGLVGLSRLVRVRWHDRWALAVAMVSHRISPEVRLERGEAVHRLDELAAREAAKLIVLGARGSGGMRSAAGRFGRHTACWNSADPCRRAMCLGAGSGEYEFAQTVP
jgi:nucleotide-binding universal stress UspA family protein